MFHNPEFYKLLKAATKATSELLHDIKNRDYQGGGIDSMIANEHSFVSCVQFLMEDLSMDRLKNIQEPKERRGEIKNTILRYIKRYLGCPNLEYTGPTDLPVLGGTGFEGSVPVAGQFSQKFKEFNEQTFNEYYEEYEQFLYTNKPIKYLIVAALENFSCSSSTSIINISNNIRLINNIESFYDDAINYTAGMPDPHESGIGIYDSPCFWLEIDYEMEKEKVPLEMREHIEQVSLNEVQRVFKILRLYKEGDFAFGLVYWCPKTHCELPHSRDDVLFYNGNYRSSNRYSLQEDDVNGLRLLLQKYTNNSNKEDFPHPAIYYLDKGVRDPDTSDKLVAYTSALESLFVKKGQEITSLLARRTAFFIEANEQKCREIEKDIKKAYGFRSNIVHGDYHEIRDELELKEYCNKTERYARQAIIKWIDMIDKGKKRQEIYDSIEENLFS